MNISDTNGTHPDVYFSEEFETPTSEWFVAVKIMRFVCIPLISCIGLCGNTLSLLVFSTRSMKRSSCSVFLASLAVVDNIFLVSLIISWVDGEIDMILISDFPCQLLVYTTYVTSFLSVWFIVGFTIERFIAICFPLHSNLLCSVFREKVTVGVLTIVALVMYNFSFWTTLAVPEDGCLHKIEYLQFLNIATWIDTMLTVIIPFLVIAVVNTMVLRAVMKCSPKTKERPSRQMKHHRTNSEQRCESSKDFRERGRTGLFRNVTAVRRSGANRANHQVRVTRTLLFVSSTFLFLNLPAHVLRLYNLIAFATSSVPIVSDKFFFFQEITAMLYYTTFSCNFFLYTLFGRNFKQSLASILRCRSSTTRNRQIMFQRFSYSRQSTWSSCRTSV